MQRFRASQVGIVLVLVLAIAVRPESSQAEGSSLAATGREHPAAATASRSHSEPGRSATSSADALASRLGQAATASVGTDLGGAGTTEATDEPGADDQETDPGETASVAGPAGAAGVTGGAGEAGGAGTSAPTTSSPTTTAAPATTPPAVGAPAPAPAVQAAGPAVTPTASELEVLALLNQERAAAGRAPLAFGGGATTVARTWAAHLAATTTLAHNLDLSSDLAAAGVLGWAAISENVGYGFTVEGVHALFMASAGHRANILDARFQQVGIGVASGGGYLWVTLDFVGW